MRLYDSNNLAMIEIEPLTVGDMMAVFFKLKSDASVTVRYIGKLTHFDGTEVVDHVSVQVVDAPDRHRLYPPRVHTTARKADLAHYKPTDADLQRYRATLAPKPYQRAEPAEKPKVQTRLTVSKDGGSDQGLF